MRRPAVALRTDCRGGSCDRLRKSGCASRTWRRFVRPPRPDELWPTRMDALVHDRYGRAHVCMQAQRFAIHRCASPSFNDGDYRDASHVQNSRRWCCRSRSGLRWGFLSPSLPLRSHRVRRCEDLAQSSSKIDVTPSCGQAWPRRSASGSGSLSRGAFHRAWKLAVKSPRKRLIQSVLDRREAEDGEPKRVDVSGDRRVGRGGDKPRVVTARVLSRGPTRRRGARRGFRRDAAPSS